MTTDYASKIADNMRYQTLLGWATSEIAPGVTAIGTVFVDAVVARQQALTITPTDGVCGPKTYTAILADKQYALKALPKTIDTLGVIAVCELKRLWLRNIIDLPSLGSPRYEECRSTLAQLIQTSLGIDWSWIDIPTNTASVHEHLEYCGTGPAYAWRAAGMRLDLRKYLFPSTDRLDDYGGYKPFDEHTPNKKPSTGPYRMMIKLDEHSRPADAVFEDGSRPRAGDIVLVGGVATGPGKHITTAELFDEKTGTFTTLETNGGGLGPNGIRQRGVVRAQRPIGQGAMPPTSYHVRRIIRPCVPDCT